MFRCVLPDGVMAGDAGSDWSAPLVHWGHYEGPCSPVPLKGPSPKEVVALNADQSIYRK